MNKKGITDREALEIFKAGIIIFLIIVVIKLIIPSILN